MVDHGIGMTSRVLPEDEWYRLVATGANAVRSETPAKGVVLVEEVGEQIVGCAVVFQTEDLEAHIDGVWVHPAFRTGRVALRLWRAITRALAWFGVSRASVYPTTPRMHGWVTRARGAHRLHVKGLFTTEAAHAQ